MDESNRIIDSVIELAIEIGREGRAGQPIGTIFVIGDTKTVFGRSFDSGVDPFHGYAPKYRDLLDPKVREDTKEIARLDGAFIIDDQGTIERSRQIIEVTHEDLKMMTTQGLGARHWAGAAITRRS
ncbi:MAG: diadenylate cyclase, partial [Planctomycetota bacterium]